MVTSAGDSSKLAENPKGPANAMVYVAASALPRFSLPSLAPPSGRSPT